MLNTFWGKDRDSIYSFKAERIQKQIDAATFEITDHSGGARDKDFIYSVGPLSQTVVRRKR